MGVDIHPYLSTAGGEDLDPVVKTGIALVGVENGYDTVAEKHEYVADDERERGIEEARSRPFLQPGITAEIVKLAVNDVLPDEPGIQILGKIGTLATTKGAIHEKEVIFLHGGIILLDANKNLGKRKLTPRKDASESARGRELVVDRSVIRYILSHISLPLANLPSPVRPRL
jgi:hypothetical protein